MASKAASSVRRMEAVTSRSAMAVETAENDEVTNSPTNGAKTNKTTPDPSKAKTNSNQGSTRLRWPFSAITVAAPDGNRAEGLSAGP